MSDGREGREEGHTRDTGRRRVWSFYLLDHGDAVRILLGLSNEAQFIHSDYHILRACLRSVLCGLAL